MFLNHLRLQKYWRGIIILFFIPLMAGGIQSVWILRQNQRDYIAYFYDPWGFNNVPIFLIAGLVNAGLVWPLQKMRRIKRMVVLVFDMGFWIFFMFLTEPVPIK